VLTSTVSFSLNKLRDRMESMSAITTCWLPTCYLSGSAYSPLILVPVCVYIAVLNCILSSIQRANINYVGLFLFVPFPQNELDNQLRQLYPVVKWIPQLLFHYRGGR